MPETRQTHIVGQSEAFAVHLVLHSRVDDFIASTGRLLEVNEEKNNSLLSLAYFMRVSPDPKTLWGSIFDDSKLVMALTQSSGGNLLLSEGPAAVLRDLARQLHQKKILLPGVVSSSLIATEFAQHWAQVARCEVNLVMEQCLYAVEDVILPKPCPGQLRPAHKTECALIQKWLKAFSEETLPEEPQSDERLAQMVDRGIQSGRFFVWDTGEKVTSMAGVSGPTQKGIRINCVYTPLSERGYGYAANLVAYLSAQLIKSGRKFCCLYTDLHNPTPNRIYQRLGYKRVMEARQFTFKNYSHSTGY